MRKLIPIFCMAALVACDNSSLNPKQEVDLIISGGWIIDPASSDQPSELDIAIRNGQIVAVGLDLTSEFASGAEYDATGRYIIPGLADMHSHFGNGIFPDDRDDSTEVLARHLYFGNTTILNLGSFQAWPERIDEMRAAMLEGRLDGPRLHAAGSLMTMTGSHPTTTIYSDELQDQIAAIVASTPADAPVDLAPLRATTLVNTPEQVAQEVSRVGDWGADAIKLTVESGPSYFGDDHPQMTPAMISAAVDAAKTYGIPVLCHVSSLDELEDCLGSGASGAVHVFDPDESTPDDLEQRMVEAEFVLIPTAAMFEGWGRYAGDPALLRQPALAGVLSDHELRHFGSDTLRERFTSTPEWDATVERMRQHLKRFHDAGGLIVAGTDTGNPYRFAGFALHEEIAFYASAGLTPREALATATVNAAQLVGAENEWGAIREGLAADFVILAANPLDNIANTLAIVDVIKSGNVVLRNELPLN